MKKTRCPSCGGVIQIDETQELLHCENCHKQYKNPLYKPPVAQPEEETVEQAETDATENVQPSAPASEPETYDDDFDKKDSVDDEDESDTTEADEAEDESEADNYEDDSDSDDEDVADEYAADYVPSNNIPASAYAPVDAAKESDSAAKTRTKGLAKSMLGVSISIFVFALILAAIPVVQMLLFGDSIYYQFLIDLISLSVVVVFAIICLALSASAHSANKATSGGYIKKAKGLMGAQIAFSLFLVLIFLAGTIGNALAVMSNFVVLERGIIEALPLVWAILLNIVFDIVCFGLSLALMVKSCKTLSVCKNVANGNDTSAQASAQSAPAKNSAPVPVTNPANPVTVQAVPVMPNTAPISRESKFTAGLWSLIGLNLSNYLIVVFTLGFGIPYAICREYRWLCKNQVIDGRRLVFEGTAGSLFGQWIKWVLLGFVTLGIYFFWLPIKKQKWITEHTHFEQN